MECLRQPRVAAAEARGRVRYPGEGDVRHKATASQDVTVHAGTGVQLRATECSQALCMERKQCGRLAQPMCRGVQFLRLLFNIAFR
jgi:hypothetical protein